MIKILIGVLMGFAIITGGGESGLYSAQIQFDTRGADTAIDSIDAEIANINEELEIINAEILTAQAKLNEKKTECYDKSAAFAVIGAETILAANESWEQIRDAWEEYTHGGSEGLSYTIRGGSLGFGMPEVFDEDDLENTAEDLPEVAFEIRRCKINWNTAAGKKWSESNQASPSPVPNDGAAADAYLEWMKCAIEQWALQSYLTSVEKFRDLRLYRISSLELRKEQIQAAVAASEARSLWCADLTTNLAGTVETLEVIGSPTQILIGPGGQVKIKDESGDPGMLANILALSPAQTGLAWALLPGWQKWRPTYRTGTISNIDYDNDRGTVTLDDKRSVAQGLSINQTPVLTAIPIEYMDCDSAAFTEGDKVMVEFQNGQLWNATPKIIGFESNPKPCVGDIYVIGSGDLDWYGGRITRLSQYGNIAWDVDISAHLGGGPSGVPPGDPVPASGYINSVAASLTGGVYITYYQIISHSPLVTRNVLRRVSPTDGSTIWEVETPNLAGACSAVSDGVIVSSPEYYDDPGPVLKYTKAGTLEWQKTIGSNHISGVDTDRSGYVYAASPSAPPWRPGSISVTLYKLDADGDSVTSESDSGWTGLPWAMVACDGKAYAVDSENILSIDSQDGPVSVLNVNMTKYAHGVMDWAGNFYGVADLPAWSNIATKRLPDGSIVWQTELLGYPWAIAVEK